MEKALMQAQNSLLSDTADEERMVSPLNFRTKDCRKLLACLLRPDRLVEGRKKCVDRLVDLLDTSGRHDDARHPQPRTTRGDAYMPDNMQANVARPSLFMLVADCIC